MTAPWFSDLCAMALSGEAARADAGQLLTNAMFLADTFTPREVADAACVDLDEYLDQACEWPDAFTASLRGPQRLRLPLIDGQLYVVPPGWALPVVPRWPTVTFEGIRALALAHAEEVGEIV